MAIRSAMKAKLEHLTTEARNPRTRDIDLAPPLAILERIHAEDALALGTVGEILPRLVPIVERAADALSRGGRLIYAGAGTSGRLGVLDAAECPPTFGTDPRQVVGLIAGGAETLVRSREGVEDRGGDGDRVRQAGLFRRRTLFSNQRRRRKDPERSEKTQRRRFAPG